MLIKCSLMICSQLTGKSAVKNIIARFTMRSGAAPLIYFKLRGHDSQIFLDFVCYNERSVMKIS